MTDTILEVKNALASIEAQVEAKLDAINKEVESKGTANTDAIKALDVELKKERDLSKQLRDEITDLAQKAAKAPDSKEAKTFGQLIVSSPEFKSYLSGSAQKARVEVKNTIVNSGNDTSRHEQLGGVVAGAFRQLTVMPTIMQGGVSSNSVEYSRELAWTNAAAGTAEGAQKPESTLTFEEVSTPVRTIPHIIKVSKQALDDSTFLASYIERRMSHGVNKAIESQVIAGDGTGQNLSGWLATGNSTVVSPLLTTDFFGLASKLKYAIISADYTPDYFYANPTDWAAAETERRATGDKAFVAANSAVSYVNNGLTPLLWGLPVVLSNSVPVGTLICKSFDADMYASRDTVMVEMFEQDGDNVQKNLVTVRAEARGAQLVFTPAAIVTGDITGITAPA